VCKDTIQQHIVLEEKILQAALGYAYDDCQEGSIAIRFFDQSNNSLNNTTVRKWTFSGIYADSSTLESPVITVTQEGTLFVTLEITTDEDCVAATDTVSLEIDFTELPGINGGSQILGCLNGGTTLNPDGDTTYTYLWTPAQGLSCTTCPSPFANPTETTTYTAVVTNISADTCEIIRQVTVLVPEDVNLLASDDIATCDSTATLSAAAFAATVTFTWVDENGNQVAGDVESLTVPVSGLGIYTVRATDSQGCHYYDTVMVKGGPVNLLSSGEIIICSDQLPQVYATNLDLNDTLAWNWTPAAAFTGPVDVSNPFYTAGPGENWLTVTATNQFGCSTTDSVYVAIVDINTDLAFDYVVSCSGNSVEFVNQSNGGFNYSWGFGDPSTTDDVSGLDNPVYTYAGEGTYQVYLTMDYNLACVDTFWSEVEVSETQFLTDFDFDYLSCDEESIQVQFFDNTQLLIDNISITCWNWVASNGQTSTLQNPVFTANKGEPFEVTLSICTSNGCSDTITKNLNPQFTEINLSNNIVLCPGDSTYLNPLGNTNYTYHWTPDAAISDPNSPNPLVYPASTQVYSVDITTLSPDTCVISRTVTVFVPEAVELSVPGDTLTCGQPVTLQAVSSVTPVNFVWLDAQGNAIGNAGSQQVNPADAEVYTVVATDAYQCTGSASVLVNNRQLDLLLDGAGIIDTCPMPSYNLCVTNLDPGDLLTFEWMEAAGGTILSGADQPCATVTSTQGQTAFFFATVTNQWGCSSEEEFNVTTYSFDPIFRELVTICPGVPTPINPGAAGSTLTYSWSPQVGLSCYDCPNPVATLNSNQFYEVTIQGFNPNEICSLTGTVQVQTTPQINLATSPADTALCEPVDLTLSALTDSDIIAGYIWSQSPDFSNPIGTSNVLELTPQGTSIYYVLATDTLGCTDTASVTIHTYPIDISLLGSFNFCQEKGPMPIVAINNDPDQVLNFQWTPSDLIVESNGDSSAISVVVPQTTVFTATVTNQFGCSETETVTVAYFNIEAAIGQLSLSEDTIILYSGETSELYVDFFPGYTYEWTPQEGLDDPYVHNPVAMPEETTVYTVLITDDAGCQAVRSDTVFVINPDCSSPNIYVPNAFTPNSDGKNDLLFVRSNIIEKVDFAIFNRWGQKVFETTDIQQGWDGTFKGELLSPDVYGYYLKATCFSGEEFFQKGNVTLLR
jgi:gliding motility-associated-like protein